MQFTILGGKLFSPIDLSIVGQLSVTAEEVERNIKNAGGLGLKTYRDIPPANRKLAVIGGGPSINDHIDEIRTFDGDIWAINGAFGWCQKHGIEATFFAVDPHPIVTTWAKGAKRALLETRCDPSVFDMLMADGCEVILFDIADKDQDKPQHERGITARGSTATAAPHLACRMGYWAITFYGCESSYPPGMSHAYCDEARVDQLVIEASGHDYLTAPDFYIQAHELSNMIRELPGYLTERSGGLLSALVKDQQRHIRWISENYAKGLQRMSESDAA